MKECPKCKVTVVGKREHCPLCQGKMQGSAEAEVFPAVPTIYREFHFLFRMVVFISIAVVVAAAAVNLLWIDYGWWWIFWAAGAVSLWAVLWVALRKRKNIPKWILNQVVFTALICVIWDWATGWHGWSLDYAVPILCLVGQAALAILSRVLKWRVEYFMVAFLVTALFGIVPIIFYAVGMLSLLHPTVICVAGSIISLAAMAVFKGESMIEELKRRLAP